MPRLIDRGDAPESGPRAVRLWQLLPPVHLELPCLVATDEQWTKAGLFLAGGIQHGTAADDEWRKIVARAVEHGARVDFVPEGVHQFRTDRFRDSHGNPVNPTLPVERCNVCGGMFRRVPSPSLVCNGSHDRDACCHFGEEAVSIFVVRGPADAADSIRLSSAMCGCGHHANQHNGGYINAHGVFHSTGCVVCDCEWFTNPDAPDEDAVRVASAPDAVIGGVCDSCGVESWRCVRGILAEGWKPCCSDCTHGRPRYQFEELRSTGLLWLINRVALHPRGYALALVYPDGAELPAIERGDVEPVGWQLIGDGSECWMFGSGPDGRLLDDVGFERVAALLAAQEKIRLLGGTEEDQS